MTKPPYFPINDIDIIIINLNSTFVSFIKVVLQCRDAIRTNLISSKYAVVELGSSSAIICIQRYVKSMLYISYVER